MKRTIAFATVILFSLSTTALAAETIKNWSAPSTWTPPSAQATGRSALVTYPPLPFIPVTPCRIADTRVGFGFSGQYGPPFMAGGVSRDFMITGQCGIPAGAEAVSFNFTVTNTAGAGFLLVFPQGGAQPNVSTLNYVASQTIANAAVVPLGSGVGLGGLTAIPGVSGFNLLIDVNGYYTSRVGASTFVINSTSLYGVFGVSSTGVGIAGFGPTAGVYGQDSGSAGKGVYGLSSSGLGVYGLSTSGVGVKGVSSASSGVTFGVFGSSASTTGGAAGVFGQDSSGYQPGGIPGTSGVWGTSTSYAGVLGQSRYLAVYGALYNGSNAILAQGFLGSGFGTALDTTVGPWGVFSSGNFGASGAKHFVEPHPTDPKKDILYSSLEGREVGTYFRGTASIVNHEAVIVIPEDFRIVTAEEGLTVQVTPIGGYSQVYVESKDLNQIVIRGSQDVPFDYMVNGVRRAFKNFEPVQTGYVFMPQSPSDRMPLYLTEEAKARLISNGTYNPDGTVNMTTAERAGFTKIWADREAEAKAAAAKNAK
jgi:hypothetical protein